ncbi:MAG: metalloregulator ArsR/SmtB family transcription factor [Ruminococcaceae bacterium]|nr:metalloregulator ArsR/SmtB family transcription factor [Oscillospiraceae bacterium]
MNLQETAALFKCLGDESRLRILTMLRQSDSYVELLASRLGLTPGTVSHHLKKLEACGLVNCSRSQFYMIYSLNTDTAAAILPLLPEPCSSLADDERYRQQVIASFIKNGRLVTIPSQLKKREIVYRHMLEEIAVGQTVTEEEISERIREWHDDYCTIRRDFISLGLMTRDKEIYTRVR